jgi:hypothetical protein
MYYGEIIVYESIEHGSSYLFMSLGGITFNDGTNDITLSEVPSGIDEYVNCNVLTTITNWVERLSLLKPGNEIHLISNSSNKMITTDNEFGYNVHKLQHIQYLKPPIIRFGINEIPDRFNIMTMTNSINFGQFPLSFSVNIYDDDKKLIRSGHYLNGRDYQVLSFDEKSKSFEVENNKTVPSSNEYFLLKDPNEVSHPTVPTEDPNNFINILITLIIILVVIAVGIPIIKKKLN